RRRRLIRSGRGCGVRSAWPMRCGAGVWVPLGRLRLESAGGDRSPPAGHVSGRQRHRRRASPRPRDPPNDGGRVCGRGHGFHEFSRLAGGAQAAFDGDTDAFVARLTASLTALTQATYLGGGGHDQANTLAIHPTTDDVYVAGETRSTDFPGTA